MIHSTVETPIDNPQVANQLMLMAITEKLHFKTQALNETGAALIDVESTLDGLSFNEIRQAKNREMVELQSDLTAKLYLQIVDLAQLLVENGDKLERSPNFFLETPRCEQAILQFAVHGAEDDIRTWRDHLKEKDH